MIDAVLWDYGNTLTTLDFAALARLSAGRIDRERLRAVEGAHRRALNAWLEKVFASGKKPRTLRFLLSDLLARAGAAVPPDVIEAAILANRARSLWRVLNPEVPAVLRKLSAAGIRNAVVSNGDGRIAEYLRSMGLLESFECVIDSQLVGCSKPDPRIFDLALSRLGVDCSRAVYVGDMPAIDVVGARACGLRAILYDPYDVFARECEAIGSQVVRVGRLDELAAKVCADAPSGSNA